MQSNPIRTWLPPMTGLALAISALCAQAATGVHVVLQAWDPRTPDVQNVVTLVDEPGLVSDSLQYAWMRARPKICEQLRLRMGLGGAAAGQTLRDITCQLDEQVVLEVTPAVQNALRARFAVSGYVEATSTTPTPLGGYADPRFSIALTANLDLILAVQPSRDQTLRVSKAQFTLNNATLDSQGFKGDLLLFVVDDMVPFFGGPNYKNMAENAINAVSVEFANDFNAALAPVNAKLAGPADAVRVGVSGSGSRINAAFAPREFTPPSNGRMTGLLRWSPAQFTPRNGCQSFAIRATVQTGPVPLYTANAVAPTREIGSFQASSVDAGTCAFTLSGIAADWSNILTPLLDGRAVQSGGGSLYRVNYGLFGDGWNGRNVTPQPVADARNYRVSQSIDAVATKAPGHVLTRRPNIEIDPRVNPADVYVHPVEAGNVKANASPVSDRISQSADTVSLNPQPLPPDPDPQASTQAVRKLPAVRQVKSSTSP